MNNLSYIRRYASDDSIEKGVPLPSLTGLDDAEAIVVLARFMAAHGYLEGDENLDGRKRNLAIRTVIDFPIHVIREYGVKWLERHRRAHGDAPWFREWELILRDASDDELARIYLSRDHESTRLRLSRPTGMLGYDVSLSVKGSGVPI